MENQINKIHCIDVRKGLKQLPDKSIDMVMTSPPYWALRDYKIEPSIWDGKKDCGHVWGKEKIKPILLQAGNPEFKIEWREKGTSETASQGNFCQLCGAWKGTLGLEPTFELFIKHLCDIFDEIKRVLKDEGTIWVNLGDTYSGAGAAGKDTGKAVYNADSFRKEPTKTHLPDKSLCLIPHRFAIEMVNRGWVLRNTIIWHKPNCMPSSVKDRFTVDYEYIFFFSKQKKYYFETQFEPHKEVSIKRAEYGLNQTNEPMKAVNVQNLDKMGDRFVNPLGRNKRCVWSINPQPFSEAHFAVFPEKLVETPIKAGCPEFVCNKCGKAREKVIQIETGFGEGKSYDANRPDGMIFEGRNRKSNHKFKGYTTCSCNAGFSSGIVLDPFMGAGTTALVALKLNRRFIGFEISPEYIKIANKRIRGWLGQKRITDW